MVGEVAIDWMASERIGSPCQVKRNIACERIILGLFIILYYNSISSRAFHATMASPIRVIRRKKNIQFGVVGSIHVHSALMSISFLLRRSWWRPGSPSNKNWTELCVRVNTEQLCGRLHKPAIVCCSESFFLEKLAGANKHKNESRKETRKKLWQNSFFFCVLAISFLIPCSIVCKCSNCEVVIFL